MVSLVRAVKGQPLTGAALMSTFIKLMRSLCSAFIVLCEFAKVIDSSHEFSAAAFV